MSWKGVRLVRGYPLQIGGKDSAQDGVISKMDHHLVLILEEVLNRIALIRVAIKGQNHELLEKFIFQFAIKERGVGCIRGADFGSVGCGILVSSTRFCTSLSRS